MDHSVLSLMPNFLFGLIIRLTWGNGKIHFRHDYYLRRRPWHQASVVCACFAVGSAFLGYTLAVLPVSAALLVPRLALAGVLLVWPFVFDTTFTIVRRLRRGENIFAAHRSHLYQRLVIAGYSHRAVTLLYAGLALVGVVLALAWVIQLSGVDWLALGLPGLLSLGLWQFVVRAETKSLAVQRATPTVGDSQ